MATGYDEEGSIARLICAGPPDCEGGDGSAGGSGGQLIPNVFYPGGRLMATFPTVPIGVNDVSVEAWMRITGIDVMDAHWLVGVATLGATFTQASIRMGLEGTSGGIQSAWTAGSDATSGQTRPMGWIYWTGIIDRSTNNVLYRDGVAIVTSADTNVVSEGTIPFHPGTQPSDTMDGIGQIGVFNVVLGPIALHTVILTAAQMLDSMRRRSVQLLATTQIAYDWRGIRGATAWETNQANMEPGFRGVFDVTPENIACPQAVNGNVVVPDLSGNNRDLAIYSQATYAADEGRCGFGKDLLFR